MMNTPSYDELYQRACERKGSEAEVETLLPSRASTKHLKNLGSDRYLAEFTRKVFQSGFVWRIVNNKWANFEEVFWNFDIERLLMMPEDMLERKASDPGIIRNYSKVKTVLQNAVMISDTERRKDCGFGEFIANWPEGIKKPGRIVDDLVEFTDMLPTLCEVSGAALPKNHPADGTSIVPVLQNKAETRKKDMIYIWYRGRVLVRDQKYSLLANTDGSEAKLTRYKGPFDGTQLENSALTKGESAIKEQFEGTIARLAKTRLSAVSKEVRSKLEKPKKKKKGKQ